MRLFSSLPRLGAKNTTAPQIGLDSQVPGSSTAGALPIPMPPITKPPFWSIRLPLAGLAWGAVWAAAFGLILPQPAYAQGVALIRDAETEAIIRSYVNPIVTAAGLDAAAVRVYIVNDPSFNAFVAEGQNIFINTGTIMRLEKPNQVIGVIAHEAGHISGGHLVRAREQIDKALVPYILGMLIGIAAAAGSRSPNAGVAVMGAGQSIAERYVLHYSRDQESRADQAGIGFMDGAGRNPAGLLESMEKLANQEILSAIRQDPYVRTHPISRDRVAAMRERVDASPNSTKSDSPEEMAAYQRMRAKLRAFTEPPPVVMRQYPETDTSVAARYARAIALHRAPERQKAYQEIDKLIAEFPKDPYFWELKGQMLFENGEIRRAIEPYRMSVQLAPKSPLLKVSLGQTLVSAEENGLLDEAITNLIAANRMESDNPTSWGQLAIAYDRKGDNAMAELATAEQFSTVGAIPDAVRHARKATKLLPRNTPQWVRAQDIANILPLEDR
jgi:predicted Zn-dependent protease